MLQSLYVKNLALIDEAEVEFQRGLNILTGETGAGKSIILGSVGLALGGKYSADMLRKGASFGLVELVFFVERETQRRQLEALDICPEDGQVILSRKFTDARSVSKINGETVTMRTLREAAAVLIDIHGQHEHQSLLYKKNHLAILDAFARGETEPLKKELKAAWEAHREKKKELAGASLDEESRKREEAFLEFELAEIDNAGLSCGEDEALEERYRRMLNGKKLSESMREAYRYTSESDMGNAGDFISRAVRSLQDIAGCDSRAAALYEQILEIEGLLNDFNHELSAERERVEFSPEEFQEAEERLNELNRLKAKYGHTIEKIFSYREETAQKLEKLRNYEDYIQELEKSCEQSRQKMEKLAEKLSKIRQEQAAILVRKIQEGLLDLNFLDVRFEMEFARLPECAADGFDDPEFVVSMNPGEPLRPLSTVASGGELSRIMLAIKTVMADKEEIDTLIFDEIDTGISGITAGKVAEKMAILGKEHQIICITHLAQIASMADAHYLIEKKASANVTKTQIQRLDEEASIAELARLLGGSAVTGAIWESAAEMKAMAQVTR